MNKIKLKLSSIEINSLQNFLAVYLPEKPQNNVDKMICALLFELLYKLQVAIMMTKKQYSISISYATGLALVEYSKRVHFDNVFINKIVGIIDQKTI